MTTKFWSQERQVNTVGTSTQYQPEIVVLTTGDYVVVYEDLSPVSPALDVIRLQRYNTFGEPIGSEITVGETTTLSAQPAVAALPNGAFAVAWRTFTTTTELVLQKFTAAGVPDGGVITVDNQIPDSHIKSMSILGLANGAVAVAYTQALIPQMEVNLRIVAANGTVGSVITVDGLIGSDQNTPYIASNGTTLAVTWRDASVNSGDVQARTYLLDGTVPSAEVTISTSVTGGQNYAPLTALPDGGYVAVWVDYSDASLRGQFLDTNLAKQGPEFVVARDSAGAAGDSHAVVATQNGNFFVAYQAGDNNFYGQAMTALGTLDGPRMRIADGASLVSSSIGLSAMPDGRVAVTWLDTSGLDGAGLGVFTSILDPRDGVIDGNSAANVLYGDQVESDRIKGFGNNDVLFGLGGDDFLDGGAGNDSLRGGTGNEMMFGFIGNDTLDGEQGNDNIWGWTGNDSMFGGDGNDSLIGEDGDDTGFGWFGHDSLFGGNGNDRLDGEQDDDSVFGFNGNDTLFGGDGNDTLVGENDLDSLFGGNGADALFGGNGNDTLRGEEGNDLLVGENNLDSLFGGLGSDTLFGSDGDDRLDGEQDNDFLWGGANNDQLFGGDGNDEHIGEAGNDTMFGFLGNDTMIGGLGNDVMGGEAGQDLYIISAGDGADEIIGFEAGAGAGDMLRLLGVAGITNFAQATAAMTLVGANIVLSTGGGNSITFVGINNTSAFAPDDFAFV